MTLKSILSTTKKLLLNLSKIKVIELFMQLQNDYKKLELKYAELEAQLQKKR